MTHIDNINAPLCLCHREYDAIRLEHQLPEFFIKVFPLTCERTTLRKSFQLVNFLVESLKPPRRIQRRPFVNIREGFANPDLCGGSDNDLIFHFSEMSCSLARA